MELSIDTSTKYASVGLSNQASPVCQIAWRSERNHSVELAPRIRSLMKQATISIEDIKAIFVAKGPGGFSALRVGVSMAKTMAMAQGIPLIGIGTLDIESHPYIHLGRHVYAILEAGRGSVYMSTNNENSTPIHNREGTYSVVSHKELASQIIPNSVICGEAASSLNSLLRDIVDDTTEIINCPPPTRNPNSIAELGYERLKVSHVDTPESLIPLYMQASQHNRARESKK